MAELGLVRVGMSITSMDHKLSRKMEPRASTPEKRLEAIRLLSEAGVPTGVMVAPIIPAINDMELERILDAEFSLAPLPFFELIGDLSVNTGKWMRALSEKLEAWCHTKQQEIDLTRLEELRGPEFRMLGRYLRMIQVQRQDFNGRVITIRNDDIVVVPLEAARRRLSSAQGKPPGAVQSIAVGVDDPRNLASAQAEIEALLRQRHKIEPGAEDDFAVRNISQIVATRTATTNLMSKLLGAVAGSVPFAVLPTKKNIDGTSRA